MPVSLGKPIVIAHRGASFYAPENTLASVKLAWTLGADAIEIDVHLSRDSKLMVIHDPSTGRTSDKNLVIAESLSDELRTLEIGSWKSNEYSSEKIPFLDEVLKTIPEDKKLLIEVKSGPDTLNQISDKIANPGIMHKILIQSFNAETVFKSKDILPSVPAFLLLESPDNVYNIINKVYMNRLNGLSVNHTMINPEFVSECKSKGLKLFTWTVNSIDEAEKVASLGVDGIITDCPDIILKTFDDMFSE